MLIKLLPSKRLLRFIIYASCGKFDTPAWSKIALKLEPNRLQAKVVVTREKDFNLIYILNYKWVSEAARFGRYLRLNAEFIT